jgi:hypothetical protein
MNHYDQIHVVAMKMPMLRKKKLKDEEECVMQKLESQGP